MRNIGLLRWSILIVSALLLLCCGQAWAGISFVNSVKASGNGATSLACPAFNTTGGNLDVVLIVMGASGATVSSITNTANQNFSQATGAYKDDIADGTGVVDIWYLQGGTQNASDTITVTSGTANAVFTVICLLYSGAASSPFETATFGTATSTTTCTTSSFSTATSGNVNTAIGAVQTGGTSSPGTNYTQREFDTGNVVLGEDRVGAPSGSQTASFTSNTTQNLVCSVASFKAASGAAATGFNKRNKLCKFELILCQ